MLIKYLAKTYTVDLSELEKQTVGCLKQKIREVVKECADASSEKLLLFHNKIKVSATEETNIEELKITNESTVFVVLIKSDTHQAAKAEPQPSKAGTGPTTQSIPYSTPNNFHAPQPGMYPNAGGFESGMEQQIIDMIVKDPESLLSIMESSMPFMSEEQKGMIKQNIEMIKKNPEMIKQMLSNPAMVNALRSQAANPMMNPMFNNPGMNPMMGSPAMSPMMNNPGMNPMMYNSPAMNPMMNQMYGNPAMNPMMRNYYYNPYQQDMYSQPPPNGPCSHGFYPPKIVNGKPEPQDAEIVYAEKLTQLNDMGFLDKEENLKALVDAKGDVSLAIDILSRKVSNK